MTNDSSLLAPDVKHLLTIDQAWTYKIIPEQIVENIFYLFIDEQQLIEDIKLAVKR
jgi:hypothetical protein